MEFPELNIPLATIKWLQTHKLCMGKPIVQFLSIQHNLKQTEPNHPIHSSKQAIWQILQKIKLARRRTSHVENHPIKSQMSKQRTTWVGESARAKLAKIQKKLSQWITVVPQCHETSWCCCWLQLLSSKAVTMFRVMSTWLSHITLRWMKGAGNAQRRLSTNTNWNDPKEQNKIAVQETLFQSWEWC